MQNDDPIMNLLFNQEKNQTLNGRWPTFQKPVDSCFGGLINNIDLNMELLLPKFGTASDRKNSEECKNNRKDSDERK